MDALTIKIVDRQHHLPPPTHSPPPHTYTHRTISRYTKRPVASYCSTFDTPGSARILCRLAFEIQPTAMDNWAPKVQVRRGLPDLDGGAGNSAHARVVFTIARLSSDVTLMKVGRPAMQTCLELPMCSPCDLLAASKYMHMHHLGGGY